MLKFVEDIPLVPIVTGPNVPDAPVSEPVKAPSPTIVSLFPL